jgi:hypothetical protein
MAIRITSGSFENCDQIGIMLSVICLGQEGKNAAMASPPSRLGCEGVRGERHPLAKLNEDIVKFIRRSGEGTVSLAKRFRVAHGTITKARKKVSWAWVESE